MQKEIEVAVVVVRNQEGKLLVQQRKGSSIPDANYKWEFPGGVIEADESPEEAAVRECKEETDCIVKIFRFLFQDSKVWKKEDGSLLGVKLFMFEAQYIEGEAKPLDTEKVAQVKWITKEEAAKLDALPNLYKALEYIE